MTIIAPASLSCTTSLMIIIVSIWYFRSSELVGSSNMRNLGVCAKALAMNTLCLCPPDSSLM